MHYNDRNGAANRRSIAAAAVVLTGLFASSALAQGAESLIVDVGACVNLQSPGERLDCYEEQVARARTRPQTPPSQARTPAPAAQAPAAAPPAAQPPAAAAAPPPAAPAAAAPSAEREASAGRRGRADDTQAEDARVQPGTSAATGTVESAISALRETVPNAWLITLENGQVWRQDYPKAYRLAVGQRVRITPERRFGGGHRLTVLGMNGFIQVDRVR
jgi:hypothetical protein